MFPTSPVSKWLVCLSFLVLTSGCKAFSPYNIPDDRPPGISLKDAPAARHQPQSLETLTGVSDKGPPRQPPVQPPVEDPAQFTDAQGDLEQELARQSDTESAGISLDDVGLDRESVQIETISIEDIEADRETQLPSLIESAVHPYGNLKSPHTISDQTDVQNETVVQNDRVAANEIVARNEQFVVQPGLATDDANANASNNSSNDVSQLPTGPATGLAKSENSPPPPVASSNTHQTGVIQDRGGNSSVMRITAKQETEPVQLIPVTVDSLFDHREEASELPPIARPPVNSNTTATGSSYQLSDQRGQNPVTAPSQSNVRQVRLVQPESRAQSLINSSSQQQEPSSFNTSPLGLSDGIQQLTWDQQLVAAIHQLDQQLTGGGSKDATDQIKLQLLRLVAGEPIDGSLDLTGQQAQYQEFWQHQLTALDHLLNENTAGSGYISETAQSNRRAALAAEQLEQAASQLANFSTLQIAHCAFTTEVRGFGQYQPAPAPFMAGQQILIYCEINNYSLRDNPGAGQNRYTAELQGQFSILDEDNRVVYQHQYQPVQDKAQKRRRDFYMFFPLNIPELGPGQYRLQLSVDDLVGNKVASSPEDLVFQVTSAPMPQPGRRQKTATGNQPPVYKR